MVVLIAREDNGLGSSLIKEISTIKQDTMLESGSVTEERVGFFDAA